MRLKQIQLSNIRSYRDATINLNEGITLLSGDIGCGKSSILLACEFALFGTSRPDLPAELLLRKGETQGHVEINFVVDNKDVIIRRNLKKTSRGINQGVGYVVINGIKKDLTSQEIKSHVIDLLGYPKDLLSKNKNYIFRYTLYTPQEEMKFILQDNSEVRLDVLRKVFNVDKYKNIRNNCQFYLKKLRKNILVLKTRLEPLDGLLTRKDEIEKELEDKKKELDLIIPKFEKTKENLIKAKGFLIGLESDQKNYEKLISEIDSNKKLIEQNSIQKTRRVEQIEKDKLDLLGLGSQGLVKVEIVNELDLKQRVVDELVGKKQKLDGRVEYLQSKIKEISGETKQVDEIRKKIDENDVLKKELVLFIDNNKDLDERKIELEAKIRVMVEKSSRSKAVIDDSNLKIKKVEHLDNCPTCLQEVGLNHKEEIVSSNQKKVEDELKRVGEFDVLRKNLDVNLDGASKSIEKLRDCKSRLLVVDNNNLNLQEKLSLIEEKRLLLRDFIIENNKIMNDLGELNFDQKLIELKKEIALINEKLIKVTKKEMVEKQIKQTENEINRLLSLEQEMILLSIDLDLKMKSSCDNSSIIKLKKDEINQIGEIEKQLLSQVERFKSQTQEIDKNFKRVCLEIEKLKKDENELIKKKEVHRWINDYFLKLTQTIEREVMTNIFQLFNELFQEWFSMLIEDDNILAMLDDSFCPVIIQNGYEVGFNNLSGGEKTCAALAYRLSLNKVINDVIDQIKTNDLIILDEPTDGFSSQQLDKVRDVLEKLNLGQTIIVSHEQKIESFAQNVIRVSKREHVSYIDC
jgi:exonuclease SbcC